MPGKVRIVFLLFLALLLPLGLANAQTAGENWPLGARGAAMGNAAVTLSDIWAASHNQAGLAGLQAPAFGAYFENSFGLKELSLRAAAAAVPLSTGVLGASFAYFGYPDYNESKIGLAYGMSLNHWLAVGIQLGYFNTHIANEYGNQGVAAGELGVQVFPVEGLAMALHVFNPTRSRYSGYDDVRLPTFFRGGLAYRFTDDFLLSAEAAQDLDNPPDFRVGAEYAFAGSLFFRAGVSTQPLQTSFGLGYVFQGLQASLAFSRHEVLGYTTHFGMSYQF